MTRNRTTVLLAWELGEGMGHATRLLSVSRRLQIKGYNVVVAAREPQTLAESYKDLGITVMTAPRHVSCHVGPNSFNACDFADVLGVCGYASLDRLSDTTDAWFRLLDSVKPDLVIADYAPLLALACWSRVPLISIGDGFVVPAVDGAGNFASYSKERGRTWPVELLLKNAQRLQKQHNVRQAVTLSQIVPGTSSVVTVPRELDIHADSRSFPAAGSLSTPLEPRQPEPDAPVFIYLKTGIDRIPEIALALKQFGIMAECYLPLAPTAVRNSLRSAGVVVHDHPTPLAADIHRFRAIVHHGGIVTMEQAMLAGKPQCVIPRHLEQQLNAGRLTTLGTGGRTLGKTQPLEEFGEWLCDPATLSNAMETAWRIHSRQENALDALDDAIQKMGVLP